MKSRVVLLAALLMLALGIGASAALAGGGNSGNAKLCQKGGWQQLQTSTGATFASQSACVSYAANSGTLAAPTLTATDDGCVFPPGGGPLADEWTLSATGFTPGSSVSINGINFPSFVFDGSGSMTRHLFTNQAGQTLTETFTDDNGIHASVTFGPVMACAQPTLTVTSPISGDGIGTISQDFTVTGTGFHPSTSGTLSAMDDTTGDVFPIWASPATDANGNFTLVSSWLIGVPCNFVATFTYTDSFGLQASATQVVNGCGG